MTASSDIRTVNDAFFQPVTALVADSPHTRPCPELPDLDFVHLGVHRVLESSPSGRGFLQEHGLRFARTPSHSNYFGGRGASRDRTPIGRSGDGGMPRRAAMLPPCASAV